MRLLSDLVYADRMEYLIFCLCSDLLLYCSEAIKFPVYFSFCFAEMSEPIVPNKFHCVSEFSYQSAGFLSEVYCQMANSAAD